MIRVVFLDVDDTLLSFSGYVRQAMREGFALYGLRAYSEDMFPVFQRVNGELWRQIEQGTIAMEQLQRVRWNRIFDALDIDFDGEVFEAYFREQLFRSAIPEEGAMELLEHLHRRYTLCVASNGPWEQQRNRLRLAGMDGYFDHFFISSKMGAAKPGAAFFDGCFRELRASGFPGLRPDEAAIVGDSLSSDMAGGARYGMLTCLYRRRPVPGADLSGVDFVAERLSDVARFL